MRLQRLDLTRYGRFTDFSIDFGQATGTDLHIIYGPNEAGKTTAFNAYLDLLYGIEKNSPYAFKHPYPTMRIGAALEFGGEVREFVRLKRQTGSLFDGHDQPITESAISLELGAITRASYCEMFSLDDDTLESGGENISQSKGNLGELLFAATAGLSALSKNLTAVKADCDRFFRPGASKIELADLKRRLVELKEERDRLDTSSSEFHRLAADREAAKSAYDKVDGERTALMTTISQIERKLNALPRLNKLRALERSLTELGELPDAPPGWTAEVQTLESTAGTLRYREEQSRKELERLKALLADRPDDALLPRLQELRTRLDDSTLRKDGADKDLPSRRKTQQEQATQVQVLLGRLGVDTGRDPEQLILSVDVTGQLQDLMQACSGHDATAEAATKELHESERRLEEARAELPPAQSTAADVSDRKHAMTSLKAILTAEHKAGHTGAIRVAHRTMQETAAALADRLEELRPWTGEVRTLRQLVVPSSAQIDAWRTAIAAFNREIDKQESEASRLETERRALSDEIAARAEAGVVSDADAVETRTQRENAWADLRRQLDAPSADRFEQALRVDDLLTSNRLVHIAAAAKQQESFALLARVTSEQKRVTELGEQAKTGRTAIHDEVAAALREFAVFFKPETAIADLVSWLTRRDQALQAASAADKARGEHGELVEQAIGARDRLTEALTAVGSASDATELDVLLELADQAVASDRDSDEQRRKVAQLERDYDKRKEDAESAQEALRRWQDDWSALCCKCWLGEKGAIPSVSVVQEVLKLLSELGKLLALKAETDDRVRKMEGDQKRYGAELQAIATELGIEAVSIGDEALRGEVDRVLADLLKRETALAGAHTAMDEAEREADELNEELETHRSRADEICKGLAVATLADAAVRLTKIAQKNELEKAIQDERLEILPIMAVDTIKAAQHLLDGADQDDLQGKLGSSDAELKALDAAWRDQYAALKSAEAGLAAVGGDDQAAVIDAHRRTVLIEIEEGTRRYISLAAGVLATTKALWLYRDRHRSSMLEQASEAFRLVTRDAYTKLVAQPDGDGDILIAIPAVGPSKEASDLSKGTRFQLYLALRLAGYREFAKARPAVPFIADDIMETFDNSRSEEALRLFGEMSKLGQVIYLTHHEHLCDIARRVCPAARFHELPSAA